MFHRFYFYIFDRHRNHRPISSRVGPCQILPPCDSVPFAKWQCVGQRWAMKETWLFGSEKGFTSLPCYLGGGWTNLSEKYARQIGSFPQVRVNIKNIWNHHIVICWLQWAIYSTPVNTWLCPYHVILCSYQGFFCIPINKYVSNIIDDDYNKPFESSLWIEITSLTCYTITQSHVYGIPMALPTLPSNHQRHFTHQRLNPGVSPETQEQWQITFYL